MDTENEDLLNKALRQKLSAAEKQRWEELLRADGGLRETFAEEAELERTLSMLPNVPISSNFTARTVQAALRDEKTVRASARPWFFRFAPAFAGVVLVCAGGLFAYRGHLRSAEMAANVRSFSEVASVMAESKAPPAEVFQNFEAIQRLSLPAEGELDLELLVALQK